jgi:hypothetical protein
MLVKKHTSPEPGICINFPVLIKASQSALTEEIHIPGVDRG